MANPMITWLNEIEYAERGARMLRRRYGERAEQRCDSALQQVKRGERARRLKLVRIALKALPHGADVMSAH